MRLFIAKINEHDIDVGVLNDVCMNTNKMPTIHDIAALQKTVVANPTGDQPGSQLATGMAMGHGPRACSRPSAAVAPMNHRQQYCFKRYMFTE